MLGQGSVKGQNAAFSHSGLSDRLDSSKDYLSGSKELKLTQSAGMCQEAYLMSTNVVTKNFKVKARAQKVT